jgi:primosomal protein N' (replication factor Y)
VSRFASVVLVHPSLSHLDKAFTYGVPEGMTVEVGSRVRVPFRRKKREGIVVEFLAASDVGRTFNVAEVLGPGIDPSMVELCRWVAEHYLSTLGEALAAAVPDRVVEEESRDLLRPLPPRAGSLGWLQRYRGGQALARALDERRHAGFSWRPGTGRAEEIASLVRYMAAKGRGVLVLLPEVRVAGETIEALAEMGDAVAWLGSDRSARDRYRGWLSLRTGAVAIAVGGRAAVYAPVPDLGLVIVDDEAHVSYKERRAPRINARPVAHERSRREGAVFVAVGTPPSVEAGAAVERGVLQAVAPSRADVLRSRPPVTVVDRSRDPSTHVPHAETLRLCRRALEARSRVVVLTHRGGDAARSIAARTVRALSPRSPARLDARTKPEILAEAIRSADCIVATPVIAKDLPIEGVGVVAIVEADAALAVPEFRGTEEAFGTWWHVARWVAAGSVVIETGDPKHPAIRALVRWDADALYRFEGSRRQETGYPPFASLARVDAPAVRADEAASALAKSVPGGQVLGPLERGGRAVIVVRTRSRAQLLDGLRPLVDAWRAAGEPFRVDVDPREVLL